MSRSSRGQCIACTACSSIAISCQAGASYRLQKYVSTIAFCRWEGHCNRTLHKLCCSLAVLLEAVTTTLEGHSNGSSSCTCSHKLPWQLLPTALSLMTGGSSTRVFSTELMMPANNEHLAAFEAGEPLVCALLAKCTMCCHVAMAACSTAVHNQGGSLQWSTASATFATADTT